MPSLRQPVADMLAWQMDCRVAWLCVLEKEYFAALNVLDEAYGTTTELGIGNGLQDRNTYFLGRIGKHKVVINLPSGTVKGQLEAHSIATQIRSTFPSISIVLLVGLGSGAPRVNAGNDVRLGDVVISSEVLMYKSGKHTDQTFQTTAAPIESPRHLLAAATGLEFKFMGKDSLQDLVDAAAASIACRQPAYARPKLDQLFKSSFIHDDDKCVCREKLPDASPELVQRKIREPGNLVQMHKGVVGSADQVLKNATERDRLAENSNILCFEMEAGAVMHATKGFTESITIRGVSDYSDGHKNDEWHNYAALTAAVCAKALLNHVQPPSISQLGRPLGDDTLNRSCRAPGSSGREEPRVVGARRRERRGQGVARRAELAVHLRQRRQRRAGPKAQPPSGGQLPGLDATQSRNAQAAIGEESTLHIYANNPVPASLNYPHDLVGGDQDSIGMFQQRPEWYPDIAADMSASDSTHQFLPP
ncbi:hypothetical protein NLG97_g1232 [Lecanicillium saksenae]|uniref:Uncharacterized protein n=1 Tax=Lecanicillium saksenae TaxID=468837 RepID=A0ACC1R8F3_9HYPO|nr:hypothetical protein NLG97_g1232 [Lecanicillium saksenae]